MGPPRRSEADTALETFSRPMRDVLTPILLYKSVFLGEWYEALLRQERDPGIRDALVRISQDTLREALEALDVMRPWDDLGTDAETMDRVAATIHRRALHDLLLVKEGSNEAVLFAAVHAPTDELRRRLVRLADRDREHADVLRALLGARPPRERPRDDAALGARERRAGDGTLARSILADVSRLRDAGVSPERLVLSSMALRHLRDEGHVKPDGTAFDLPVDVDFGWNGECHALITDERVRLTEMLSKAL